ncbi:MAG TPA: hypothetical protein VMZ31_15190 [Phycisphaerae bacterium]|nr:hypothetical protein [Phycisphaerae bacterium]
MCGAWRVLGFASALLLSGSARLAGQTTAPADSASGEAQQPRTVELDFRYALQSPVLLYQFEDEGVMVEPRRNYAFLLAPFHYEVTERRYSISAGVRVETETGKRCRTLGIAVAGATGATGRFGKDAAPAGQRPGTPSSALDSTFQLPSQSQPLYERIQVELRGGEAILQWYNTRSPTPARGTDGGRAAQRPTPAPRGAGQTSDRRGEMPATGWAALLIEYPQEASKLTVQFRGDPPETIDLALISLVQAPADRSARTWEDGNELATLAQQVGRYAASGDAAMARLAVAWLAQVLNDYRPTPDPQQPDLAVPTIEGGLLVGVANPDQMAAQWAWSALSARQSLSSIAIQFIAQQADQTVLKRLVSLIGQELAGTGQQADQDSVGGARRPDRRQMRSGDQDVSLTVPSALPDSQASPACFAALQAILQSRHTDVVTEAIRLILTDATKQSIACLALVPPGAAEIALAELANVTSQEVKTTAVKTMLLTPSPALMKQIAEAGTGWALTISDPQDPLLAQPVQTHDRQKQITILRLLQKADMQAVLDSSQFRDLIEALTGALAAEDVRREAYLLLATQWLKAGGAATPAQSFDRVDRAGRGGRSGVGGGSLEQLLLEALAQSDKAVQKQAAAALLKTGRVAPLIDQLSTRVPVTQVASLLSELAADLELRVNADTLTLFGAMLGHSDPNIGREALSAIDKAYGDSGYPEHERWRIRLAVKRRLAIDGLAQRLGDAKPEIAGMAATISGRLSGTPIPPGDAKKAAEQLRQADTARAADPTGTYHLLVTTVVNKPEFELADVPGRSGVKELTQLRWRQVRASASGMVTISKQADGTYPVAWDGKVIGSMGGGVSESEEQADARGRSGTDRVRRGGQPQQGPMRIDTAELVKQALAEVSAMAGTTRVPSPLPVGLSHVILGMWEGLWSPPQDQRAAIDYQRQQYRVDAQGRVILGQLPESEIQEISAWLELESN